MLSRMSGGVKLSMVVFSLILLTSFPLFSQQIKTVQDIGGWTGAGLDYRFKKPFTISVFQEFRFFESFSKLEQSITEAGLEYAIDKRFKIGSQLRYSYARRKDHTFSNDVRYSFDFKYKLKLPKHFTLRYRARYQNLYKNLFGFTPEGTRSNFRNKLTLGYSLNAHFIYFSGEINRNIGNFQAPFFNKMRLNLGDKFDLQNGKLSYSLSYERELSTNYPLHFLFCRFYYTFQIQKK